MADRPPLYNVTHVYGNPGEKANPSPHITDYEARLTEAGSSDTVIATGYYSVALVSESTGKGGDSPFLGNGLTAKKEVCEAIDYLFVNADGRLRNNAVKHLYPFPPEDDRGWESSRVVSNRPHEPLIDTHMNGDFVMVNLIHMPVNEQVKGHGYRILRSIMDRHRAEGRMLLLHGTFWHNDPYDGAYNDLIRDEEYVRRYLHKQTDYSDHGHGLAMGVGVNAFNYKKYVSLDLGHPLNHWSPPDERRTETDSRIGSRGGSLSIDAARDATRV